MPPHTSKAELETILGMVNYLARFAPNLAEVTSPMNELLTEDYDFSWDKPQADAFQKVKEIIQSDQVIDYFNPKKPLVLKVYASKFGLGATFMQNGKPIAFAGNLRLTMPK
jgi:hypothetical protein